MKHIYSICLLLAFWISHSNTSFSQGEVNNWIMSRDIWLDFSSGYPEYSYIPSQQLPQVLTGPYPPYDWDYSQMIPYNYFFASDLHSASISDKNGNLLYFANGETIYHRQLDTLWTSNDLTIDRLEALQSFFVLKPGNSNRHLYFTVPDDQLFKGLRYTELDIALNGGLGGVVGTPDVILMDTTASKISATYHANGRDVWILAHEIYTNNFRAYLLTENGISSNNYVISSVGSTYWVTYSQGTWGYASGPVKGQMKFSPSGDKLVAALCGSHKIELFDFNNETGVLSNPVSLSIALPSQVEFSPDGTIAYIGANSAGAITNYLLSKDTNGIYQIDLLAGNAVAIENSVIKISPLYYVGSNNYQVYSINSMQLTYNGNILVGWRHGTTGSVDTSNLHVISSPNANGNACNYAIDHVVFPPSPVKSAFLPSFFPPFFDRNILFANTCLHDSVLICTQTNTHFDSIRWEFTDPLLGLISIPNQDTIYHQFPGFGPYDITLKRYRNSGMEHVVKKRLYIYPNASISLPADTLLCPGESISFTATADSCVFAWTNNQGYPLVNSDTILINQPGKYWPVIQNFDNVCGSIDTVEVHYVANELDLGNDQLELCSDSPYTLSAAFIDTNTTYLWSNGATSPAIETNQNGSYWVEVQAYHCTFQDTVLLGFDPPLTLGLTDTLILCEGEGSWLFAGDFTASFQWSPGGEITPMLWVDSAGTYTVTATNGCGNFIDSTVLYLLTTPQIDLGDNTTICSGSQLALSAFFPFSNYQWNNGESSAQILVSQTGIYEVTVSNICGSNSDSVQINHDFPLSFSLGTDTLVCEGSNFSLIAPSYDAIYQWSDGNSGIELFPTSTGLYALTISNACGDFTDEVFVEILASPSINLPTDTAICHPDYIALQVTNPHSTYQWNTGGTNSMWITNSPGIYSVTVSNICGTSSHSIDLQVDDSLYFTLGADTLICLESNFELSPSPAARYYLWSNGSNDTFIHISQCDLYWLEGSNACNTHTDSIYIEVSEHYFSFSYDTLVLDSSSYLTLDAGPGHQAYQWSTGQTQSSIEVSAPGEYWLIVSNEHGCTASDTLSILPYVSISETPGSNIRIFPNPTNSELHIQGLPGQVTIELYNLIGEKLLSIQNHQTNYTLHMQNLANGIYLLSVSNHEFREIRKVVKSEE